MFEGRYRPAVPRPRRVGPYAEGSWGRCLDVRANQLSQFPAYVAGRVTTARTSPEGAVPIARGTSQASLAGSERQW